LIQDIAPSRLYNEFHPNRECRDGDAVVCFSGRSMLVREEQQSGRSIFPEKRELSPGLRELSRRYLFAVDARSFFLSTLPDGGREVLPPGFCFRTLREIRAAGAARTDLYAAYTAFHLASWYRDHVFCGRCGQRLGHSKQERALVCPSCGHVVYPRINPAIIVGVTDGDRIVLTKYAHGYADYFALVAGFVEIGETLEECVAREVREETGLQVKNIRYYRSQPWGSALDLLAGFYADVDGSRAIHRAPEELKEALWVKREDIELQPDDLSLTNEMMLLFQRGEEPC
jgi:NAD+ diphosphatase